MTAKVNEILVAYERERARHLREQMNVDSSKLIDEALKERIDIEQKLKAARENKKKPAKSGKGRRVYSSFDVFEANRIEQRNLKQKGDELDAQIRTFTQNTEKLRREVDSGSANDVGRRFDGECRQFDARLPIYAKKNEIIEAVTSHPVVVIVGETGSGKSTQIAQYLADANLFRLARSRIICTQPRRIAAKALARKVDDEFSSNGRANQVDVWVGGHQTVDAHARIVYATDRMLLSACVGGELGVEAFQGCIIVDEAHERSIYTDLLLALLKQNVSRPNSRLKLVITSATIDTDLFQRYFDMCPVLSVSGRAYPVDVVWWSPKEPPPGGNYVDAAIRTVCDIHEKKEEGDILVFLTGQAEIEYAVAIMSQNSVVHDCWVLPLHGKLQPDEQQCVFEELPPGYERKIVFATNIAETSVTIPGVRFVVDAGYAKVATSNRSGGMSCLSTQFISQSSANQRMGRAGRCSPGTCYRLYGEDDYNNMDKQQTPEILRLHLGIAILKLLEAGIGDVRAFDFVQRPSDDAIASAMTTLRFLGAVSEGNRLSNLGENMAKLPTDPRLSKMILYSGDDDYDVVAETIVAASVISAGGSVFYRGTTSEERTKCDEMKVQFADEFGDVASYVKIFAAWERVEGGTREKNRWCVRHCINAKSMRAAKEASKELRFLAARIVGKSLAPSSQGNTRASRGVLERVSKLFFLSHHDQVCASSGFFDSGYVVPRIDDCTVPIHPGSPLHFTGVRPEWLVYRELRQTSRKFIADVVVVSPTWIDLLPDGAIDFEAIKRRKLQEDLVRNLHPDLVCKLIGKGGCVIRELQASVAEACHFSYHCSVIVNNDVGVRVRVQRQHVALAKKLVSERVEAIVRPLVDAEEIIGLGRGTRSRVRAGAVTAGVSTKNEFTQLSIYDLSTVVRKEEVIRVLQPFGVLDVVHVPPKSPPVAAAAALKGTASRNFWGFAMFGDHVNAMRAYETVREIQQDGVGHPLWLEPKDHSGFQVKFVWSPGVSMQQGTVRFRNSDVAAAALRAFADRAATSPVTSVSYSRKDPTQCSLYFSRCSPSLDERQLEEFFERAGIEQPRETAVFRKENPLSSDYDDDILLLSRLLEGCVGRNFRIFPGIKNKRQRSATADFRTAAEMTTAMETLDGITDHFGCQRLLASRSYSARLSLKKEVMAIDYVRQSVEAEVAALRRELRGYVSPVRQSKTKTWPLMIACDDEREVAIARARILRRVEGERYALTAVENFTSLSCLSDRTIAPILQEIQERTTTAIVPSHRTETLHIHGSPDDVDAAKRALDELFATVRVRHINLKGDGLPPGLMQAVFQKYDASAKKLAAVLKIDESQLYVDCRRHRLVVCCSEEKHKKLDVIMRTLQSGLSVIRRGLATAAAEEDSQEECGVCFSPIIFPNVYTLLLCGHRYCVECLRSQMEAAVRGKQLPILCCVKECSMPISLIDVKSLLTNEESQAKLWLHSLTHFVEKSGGAFKFCPTPDCRSVFKTSSTAAVFTCLECGSETCTACSNEAHRGITCEEFDLMRKSDDGGLKMWIERTTEGRESKPCPFCKITISKNGGCNYVQCTACKKHLCWSCMAHFTSGTDCYNHISSLEH